MKFVAEHELWIEQQLWSENTMNNEECFGCLVTSKLATSNKPWRGRLEKAKICKGTALQVDKVSQTSISN